MLNRQALPIIAIWLLVLMPPLLFLLFVLMLGGQVIDFWDILTSTWVGGLYVFGALPFLISLGIVMAIRYCSKPSKDWLWFLLILIEPTCGLLAALLVYLIDGPSGSQFGGFIVFNVLGFGHFFLAMAFCVIRYLVSNIIGMFKNVR